MPEAIVLLSTEVGAEEEVFKELLRIRNVIEAYIVYGVYDMVAKIRAGSHDELREVIVNRIRRIPKVRSTTTMVVVESSIK